ncbi:hypothetical protein TanjilG_15234 [Lupinus angustifolius]|uniref:Calmodulin-binding protein n=1 Tax=Lupinus angustifolius TaxID=3871 RepID=A0A1J7HJH8_LUPAN|nr:PREDICTED: homeobox protein 9 [Lupinus angustifolius]OIW01909.1 hypothetical protein TanjilG_15234 [Lupinus angustifolius]
MEVMVAPTPFDFNFNSNCSSPYITAPSSPQPFPNNNFFFSAPTTPTHSIPSSFHHQQLNNNNNNDFHARHSSSSLEPSKNNYDNNIDFDFNSSCRLDRHSLSAAELFHGGKIRPVKVANNESSFQKDVQAIKSEEKTQQQKQNPNSEDVSEITVTVSSISSNNRKTITSTYASLLSSISFTKGYRKWRLKDFLLFRSASEGRGTNKDPLRKYTVLSKTTTYEDVRNSSFRSTESSGSVSRRRGPVSAHELHYTVNRAASEELRKKTLLPYKQGLLGCLGLNDDVNHMSRRIGSVERL